MPKHGKFWKNKDLHAWMEGIEGGIALPPQFYGAEADGATDDTSAINQWIGQEGLKFLPYGDYLASGSVTGFSRPTLILADNAEESGTPLPFLAITIPSNNFKNIPQVHAFVLQDTSLRSDSRTVDIRRWVNTDDGHVNPHALHVETIKYDSNAQCEWAISGVLYSYNTIADNGSTAVSGSAFKMVDGGAGIFAGHFQARDDFKASASTTVTGCIGAELNAMGVGPDHPTANGGLGNRRGIVVIPITNTSVSGWNTVGGNFGDFEAGIGVDIQTDAASRSNGYWRVGLSVREISGNPNPVGTGVRVFTSGAFGVSVEGTNSTSGVNVAGAAPNGIAVTSTGTNGVAINGNNGTASLRLGGNSAYGALALGTYSSSAFRMNGGETFALEGTNAIKFTYGVVSDTLGFYNRASKPTDATGERIGFNMTASPHIRVAGTQVVGARNTGWAIDTGTAKKTANATYSGTASVGYVQAEMQALMDAARDATQTIKAIKDAMFTTHGLIGA